MRETSNNRLQRTIGASAILCAPLAAEPERSTHQTLMEQMIPVETEVGVLRGRDCLFLDRVELPTGTRTVVLHGEINGSLCSQPADAWVEYRLEFRGVLALRMIELDSWRRALASSFFEVQDSTWVRALGGKVESRHRHFVVQTYDDVFELVCETYALSIDSAKKRESEAGRRTCR
jgi:hypothetical protein